MRGEGIFLQFREDVLSEWQLRIPVFKRAHDFREAHRQWCLSRQLSDSDSSFPGMRYILLSHALMRQLALECGYSAASMRECLYSRPGDEHGPPMAGILLYTSAPDSEGTFGGLVQLGEPGEFGRHLSLALEQVRLCASDPLCAEHKPTDGINTLHGAACHACLFAPETSCERGNRYLDRAVLAPTFANQDIALFEPPIR